VRCDVVVVSYCSAAQLPDCLSAVEENVHELSGSRVFVVDNASTDDSAAVVRDRFPNLELIENSENVGYGAAINRALEKSDAEFVLCMNPDVRLHDGAIKALFDCLQRHDDAVAAAPKLTYPDGSFHAVCRRFPTVWRNFCHVSGLAARLPEDSPSRHWLSEVQHDRERDVEMVSGACILFRRQYLDRVGRFDENIFLYEEETDMFLPSRTLGRRAYYCPTASAVHTHGERPVAASNHDEAPFHRLRSKYYVFDKHYGAITARLAYLTDRFVFGVSLARHRFTSQFEAERTRFELAARAYESSKRTDGA
jgi:GT2 family glycosyltransferase